MGLIFAEFATSLKSPKIDTAKNKPYNKSSLRVLEIAKIWLSENLTHLPSVVFAKISWREKFLIYGMRWAGVNNWFPDRKSDTFWDVVMKLHTLTPHESRMHPIDFEVKGQGHGAWLIVNGFRTITDSVINLWSWNFIHLLPMSQGCTPLILRSEGQGHGAWLIVNGFRTITESVIKSTYDHETSYTYSPWVKDAPYWF